MITTQADREFTARTRELLAANTPDEIMAWLRAEFPGHTIQPQLMESWLIGALKARCRTLLDTFAADA